MRRRFGSPSARAGASFFAPRPGRPVPRNLGPGGMVGLPSASLPVGRAQKAWRMTTSAAQAAVSAAWIGPRARWATALVPPDGSDLRRHPAWENPVPGWNREGGPAVRKDEHRSTGFLLLSQSMNEAPVWVSLRPGRRLTFCASAAAPEPSGPPGWASQSLLARLGPDACGYEADPKRRGRIVGPYGDLAARGYAPVEAGAAVSGVRDSVPPRRRPGRTDTSP